MLILQFSQLERDGVKGQNSLNLFNYMRFESFFTDSLFCTLDFTTVDNATLRNVVILTGPGVYTHRLLDLNLLTQTPDRATSRNPPEGIQRKARSSPLRTFVNTPLYFSDCGPDDYLLVFPRGFVCFSIGVSARFRLLLYRTNLSRSLVAQVK